MKKQNLSLERLETRDTPSVTPFDTDNPAPADIATLVAEFNGAPYHSPTGALLGNPDTGPQNPNDIEVAAAGRDFLRGHTPPRIFE